MIKTLFFLMLVFGILSGCANLKNIPINNDGEVKVGKDTFVGMEDLGVGKVKNKF